MRILVLKNWMEELQDYLAANSGLGYVVGTNFFIGDEADLDATTPVAAATIYEEGADIPLRQRVGKQERTVRFLARDSYAQAAVNRAWDVAAWLGNLHAFVTDTFRAWVLRFDTAPSVTEGRASGTWTANFVVTFLVMTKV